MISGGILSFLQSPVAAKLGSGGLAGFGQSMGMDKGASVGLGTFGRGALHGVYDAVSPWFRLPGGANTIEGGLGLLGGLRGGGPVSLLGGGGGMFGGGSGDEKSKISGHGSPQSALFGDLLGMKLTPSGWDQSSKRFGLFGKQSRDLLGQMRDFMFDPMQPSAAEQGLANQFLGSGTNPGQAADLFGGLNQGFSGLLQHGNTLAETGFRTDATPIYNEAMRRLRSEALPSIAEMVGSKVGLNSQSFIDAAAKESANLLGQASLRDTELAEAAAQRRAAGLPIAAQLQLQRASAPMSFMNDLMSLGTGFRNIMEAPKARGFQAAMQLAGMPTQPMVQAGYNPAGSGGANQLSALASSLPGLLQSIGSLFGSGGSTPGGGSNVNSGNLSNALFSRGPIVGGL